MKCDIGGKGNIFKGDDGLLLWERGATVHLRSI